MTWLHIGTSKTVSETLPVVRQRFTIDRTITTNGGIEIEQTPDVYVLVDSVACSMYAERARLARSRGTIGVTLRRKESSLRQRDVHDFDEFLTCLDHEGPRKCSYGRFRYSGPLCLEYAANHGAKRILIVGCDGYTGQDDYFNGHVPLKGYAGNIYADRTVAVLQPAMNEVALAFPEVEFVQFGNPVYRVLAFNWRVEAL